MHIPEMAQNDAAKNIRSMADISDFGAMGSANLRCGIFQRTGSNTGDDTRRGEFIHRAVAGVEMLNGHQFNGAS